jgi:hypothetical protein
LHNERILDRELQKIYAAEKTVYYNQLGKRNAQPDTTIKPVFFYCGKKPTERLCFFLPQPSQ